MVITGCGKKLGPKMPDNPKIGDQSAGQECWVFWAHMDSRQPRMLSGSHNWHYCGELRSDYNREVGPIPLCRSCVARKGFIW